jgi:hypothetical protein
MPKLNLRFLEGSAELPFEDLVFLILSGCPQQLLRDSFRRFLLSPSLQKHEIRGV